MKKAIKNIFAGLGILFIIFVSGCSMLEDETDTYTQTQTQQTGKTGNTIGNTIGNTQKQAASVSNTIANNNKVIDYNDTTKRQMRSKGVIRSRLSKRKGDGSDKVTVLVYMNGSDLESEDGSATEDLKEMVSAGSSDQVNVLVQTMGTKKWSSRFGIASDHTQRYEISKNGLNLVDDSLGQLDCTEPGTLTDFIKWGAENYPANRYILLFWDHGGGPVYGFGYDQWNSDEEACLSMDEMQDAIKNAGVAFDIIGMDCCIMSCMELGCALYDYTDYMILSEDFESGLGWYYTTWLKELYKNPSIDTVELGKSICDSMVNANENSSDGDSSIMAVIDESMMPVLYSSWMDFAYANESELLGTNYCSKVKQKKGGRILPSMSKKSSSKDIFDWFAESDVQMSDYYVTDIMAVAQNIDSDESAALSAAVNQALVYVCCTSDEKNLTGLSVTLPYGDSDFYKNVKTVFCNAGMDQDYVDWLSNFTGCSNSSSCFYDYDDWDSSWSWDDYEDDYDWDSWEEDEDWEDWDFWFDDDDWSWYDDDYWYDEEDDYWYDDEDWYDDDYWYDDDDDYWYEDDWSYDYDWWPRIGR